MMFQSALKYRNGYYLKLGLAIAVCAGLIWVAGARPWYDAPAFWLNYAYGVMAGALTLWLAWYGIRKRQYRSGRDNLAGWLSAHIYVGIAAIFITTMHAGIEFAANVHALTFILYLIASASGILGMILITTIPPKLARTADGRTFDIIIQQIAEINRESRSLASPMDDDANRLVRRSVQYTTITGGFWRRLTARYPDEFMAEAVAGMRRYAESGGENAELARRIVVLLARKSDLLAAARRHVQLQTILVAWRFLHIPVTMALLAALIVHVFVVHYYW